jgi:hypothetical protein
VRIFSVHCVETDSERFVAGSLVNDIPVRTSFCIFATIFVAATA